ncbi:GMC family oxidoreductase [Herbaspirillum sp. RTI4]|uniref:GMC family oxidoreductase n=1 Tax=Herbaspirillum sp. RTI4 TaxID=3048640 RepID=UPI002AB377FF|nr:GMC family oxidoreductase [Herbaspirillum sp. RTI4]MDY7577653.1 GMC family oxidoreductase [Herbaspirillum sp. RTI4]MEA9982181.1 GMC family oxidoreductase [Herbaspirillum sp. RTI4]
MSDPLSADVVVIGSGIVGALAAHRLALQGASVLILEAGPRVSRGRIVENFRNSPRKNDFMSPYPPSALAPHPVYQPVDNEYLEQAGPYPYKAEYIRMVGGTTWHWAAQAWRVLPNDLRIKTLYGVGRDWPISYDDLEPFYYEAEVKMGVSGAPNTGSPRNKPFPMLPVAESFLQQRFRERLAPGGYEVVENTTARNSRAYDGRPACCGNNNCMPICPIDAQYHGGLAADAAEKAGARLVANAVVYRIEHDESGRIVAVHYYDADKLSHRVTGKTFILAANGIESPKLLLLSASDKFKNGLANSSGSVGHNLMDHPSNGLVFDADEDLWPGRGPMSPASINSLRDGAFRSEHAAFRIDIANSSQVLSVTQNLIAKGVYGAELERQIRQNAARQCSIKNVLEVLPNPENRIVLSDKKDALGIPRPRVHYQLDEYVHRGMLVAREEYTRIAQLMGGTNLRYSADGVYGNNQHITGTMSMGSDPTDSVVDGFGRTHDHPNLYIASTGVMPTAATVNSTLTAVAIALRSAEHIHANA